MSSAPTGYKGRFPAAPEPFNCEAPSGWVSRVAHAHDLSVLQMVQFNGVTASELDAGYGESLLSHIATGAPCHTWPATSDVIDGLREIGLMPDYPPRVIAEDWWAYCPSCWSRNEIRETRGIQAVWCQPLAFICLEHAVYLRPWPRDREVQRVDGDTAFKSFEPHLLTAQEAGDDDISFARLLLSPGRSEWAPMACAVFDLTDALATRTGVQGQHPPLLRELLAPATSIDHAGSVRMPAASLWSFGATTRLSVLRYMAALSRPPEIIDDDVPDWLLRLARRPGYSVPQKLRGVSCDELYRIFANVNAGAREQLARRASRWPDALRHRTAAAVLIGSLANLA